MKCCVNKIQGKKKPPEGGSNLRCIVFTDLALCLAASYTHVLSYRLNRALDSSEHQNSRDILRTLSKSGYCLQLQRLILRYFIKLVIHWEIKRHPLGFGTIYKLNDCAATNLNSSQLIIISKGHFCYWILNKFSLLF